MGGMVGDYECFGWVETMQRNFPTLLGADVNEAESAE